MPDRSRRKAPAPKSSPNEPVTSAGAGRLDSGAPASGDPLQGWCRLDFFDENAWRFQQLADLLEEVFYVVEPESGRTLYVSPSFERVWGLPAQALYDNPLVYQEAVLPEDKPLVLQAFESKRAGRPNRLEYRIRRPDGEVRWIWDRNFTVSGPPDGPVRVVGLAADVTEYRIAQESLRQMQRMEALGHLSGGLAHDVNNVLSVVLGNLERLSSMNIPGDAAALCISEAVEAVRRGRDITDSLLGYARQQPLQRERFDLDRMLLELLPLLRRTAGPGIQVELLPMQSRLAVDADAGSLGSALINLVANARDAMPSGGRIELSVCLHRDGEGGAPLPPELEPGSYALVCVRDEGQGMPPEVLARVLEPLFTTKPPHVGTGLGLPMAYGLLRRHGGTLTLHSVPDVGTQVCLYLPLPEEAPPASGNAAPLPRGIDRAPRPSPPQASPYEPAPAPPPPAAARFAVLAVEDDPGLSQLIELALQEAGLEVTMASDSAAAMRALAARPFDLLLTDHGIPGGMNGSSLARWAVQRWPGLAVVLASGSVAIDDQAPAGSTVLRKPFGPRELLEAVDRIRASVTLGAAGRSKEP